MKIRNLFLLTEASVMLPLVRRILVDVREARSTLNRARRTLRELPCDDRTAALCREQINASRNRLREALQEADDLGIEITSGVRCEALFPFEHRWIGPNGDGRIRRAYFVYNDALETIEEWFFKGWPDDRRRICPEWWNRYRDPRPAFRVPRMMDAEYGEQASEIRDQ